MASCYWIFNLFFYAAVSFLGPPAFGGRYVPQLADRSALRGLRPLGLALRATAAHR